MVKEVIFSLQDASAGYTDVPLLKDITFFLHRGDRLTLVGKNGCGKSTLFNLIDGKMEIEKGERFMLHHINIARLHQEPKHPESGTALDLAMVDDRVQQHRAEQLLHALGVNPDMDATTLSGGQLRRVNLAIALASDPDILLLDEPTNHLDLPTVEWLEEEIKSFRGAVVVISHDRKFLENISNGVLWLEDKLMRRMNRSFAHFDEWQDEVYEEEEKRQRRLTISIKQEERYALRGVTARRKRNQKRVERLNSLREQRRQRVKEDSIVLTSAESKSAAKMVFEARAITKRFDDLVICDEFSTRILRGDRIGILGANGTGKSTFVKMLLKDEPLDGGNVRRAKNLTVAYFDQYREQLDMSMTPWQILGNGGDYISINGKDMHVVGYLKKFLFDHEDAKAKVSTFSGGQKNRLLLAKILANPTDVMVLDEPTNDLDMDTLDVLEDMLVGYDGTLIIVSHDRDFLDRLVGSLIVMEGKGVIQEVVGGWEDYLRIRGDGNFSHKVKSRPKRKTKDELEQIKYDKAEVKVKLASTRMSPKEQHDLKHLPLEIENLQATIVKLTDMLGSPTLYVDNPDTFNDVSIALGKTQEALDIVETHWLEVSMKAESIKFENNL